MNYGNINKKELKKEAKELLDGNNTRQETYEILNEKCNANLVVADVIKTIPSARTYKKYGVLHLFLLAALIAFSYYKFTILRSYVPFFWYGLFAYFVIAKKVNQYFWISIYQGFVLLPLIFKLIKYSESYNLENAIYILLPELLLLLFPIGLMQLTLPKPIEKKQLFENENGQNKIRIIYKFKD